MSRITPVIIFSSASVAVPGSMTVLGAWVATGWGLLQRRDLNPRLVRIRAPFHRRCRNAWALAEQLSDSQPAGRLIGSSESLNGSLLTPIAAPIAYLPINMVAHPTFGRISVDEPNYVQYCQHFANDG